MTRRRRRIWALAAPLVLSAATACSLPPVAGAAKRPAELRITPSAPIGSKSVFVRWRADHARRRARTYTVELRIAGSRSDLCSASRTWTIRRSWNRFDTVSVRLRPTDRTHGRTSLWCPGRATLRVRSKKRGGGAQTHALLRFAMREDPSNPVPSGTPAEVELLEGSSMIVRVPGRPDRTSPVTGQLTGQIPGRSYRRGVDMAVELTGGALSIEGLQPDPLCTPGGRDNPIAVPISARDSAMTLFSDDRVAFTLALSEDPVVMTGCSGPPSAATSRSLRLTGASAGDAGLTRIEASGTIEGVRLADGAEASITLDLILAVDVSVP